MKEREEGREEGVGRGGMEGLRENRLLIRMRWCAATIGHSNRRLGLLNYKLIH